MKNLSLVLLVLAVSTLAWAETDYDGSSDDGYSEVGKSMEDEDPLPPCDYPDVDFLADRILDHLSNVVPAKYSIPDDNEGKVNARNIEVYHLNNFVRRLPSALACNEKGLALKIPIRWEEPLKSDFEVAPGFTRKYYIPATGIIYNMQAEVTINVVFVGEPAAHVTALEVTQLRDVEVGVKGEGFFARAARKLASLIANEFRDKIRHLVEENLQTLLDSEMVNVPLRELGFE